MGGFKKTAEFMSYNLSLPLASCSGRNSLVSDTFTCVLVSQEAAQALIYAGMAGSKLEGIQDKVNEYLDRVEALHNASKLREPSVLP